MPLDPAESGQGDVVLRVSQRQPKQDSFTSVAVRSLLKRSPADIGLNFLCIRLNGNNRKRLHAAGHGVGVPKAATIMAVEAYAHATDHRRHVRLYICLIRIILIRVEKSIEAKLNKIVEDTQPQKTMKLLASITLLLQLVVDSQQYELGQTYVYHVRSDTFLNYGSAQLNQNPGRQVGYGLEAKARLTALWRDAQSPLNRIVEIDLHDAHLTVTPADKKDSKERKRHASNLDRASHQPMYALFKDNEIVRVWVANEDDSTYLNVKKGVASMFQYQVTSEIKKSQVDVSGKCKVVIKADGQHIKKTKDECVHPDLEQYEHPHSVRSVKTQTTSQTNYQLRADLSAVQTATASESIRMSVNAWPEAAIEVTAHHLLKLEVVDPANSRVPGLDAADEVDAVRKLEAHLKDRYAQDTIIARPHQLNHAQSLKGSLLDRIALFRDQLTKDKLATLTNTIAFVTLLESFRVSSENEVFDALKSSKNANILPQLLDIAGASQTIPALKGSLRVVNLDGKDTTLSERFLMSLSMASHPSPQFIAELLALADRKFANEKVYATLVASLGSVLRHAIGNDAHMKEAHIARLWLETRLAKCNSRGDDADDCKLVYVRALRNAAQPTSIPVLLNEVKLGSKKVGPAVLKALKEIGPVYFTPELFDTLEHIYFETHSQHESTARALAAEMIFTAGDRRRIERVLAYIHNVGCPELQTLIANKFRELVELDRAPELKRAAANHTVANYDTLAHEGISSTFTRLLSRSQDLNTTYTLNMELGPGGLLKQTTFGVNVQTSSTEQMPLISVNIFAAGLAGVAGGDAANEVNADDEEEATAGIALSMLGVEMRPYVFFRGTGELMGHVWSGTASEYTPALQGNFLLMDHMQLQPLLSGLIVQLQLKGTLSADLGGSVQISLWNRNSHSIVHSAGAGLIQGSARLLSDVATARVEVNVGFESYLDFVTDFDFYEKPYKMCMVMTTPGLSMKYHVRKHEAINGKQHLVRTLRRRSSRADGKSYALTQKNSELCAEMFAERS
ncbi:microsomal triglyceride transfer protein large subunit-like [Tropilaelaps mercedesae]|uniref:Microsomal triglyceride transfer protein large subunit-like n=1 Tax=Tropilaelaps mercedesae TaxID=418985 RepID=A0A1V9XX06_9ACAR|nr:microsomal triglyceride transfer protein large subunit-like [Tropilaelaps mercedesae]